jgi:hypothetical protein
MSEVFVRLDGCRVFMSRILLSAAVIVPKLPRARFLKRLPPGSAQPFEDVTERVEFVNITRVGEHDSVLSLERLDGNRKPVWSTRHYTVEEAQWQAEFEYELNLEAWKEPAPEAPAKAE